MFCSERSLVRIEVRPKDVPAFNRLTVYRTKSVGTVQSDLHCRVRTRPASKALKKLSREALAIGLLFVESKDHVTSELRLAAKMRGFIGRKTRT